jgi:outer membrane protein insertion porin family
LIIKEEKDDLEKLVDRFWKNKYKMLIYRLKRILTLMSVVLMSLKGFGQEEKGIANYLSPGDYILKTITISGVKYLDSNALIGISGLKIGEEVSIPGDKITLAVQKLWEQGLFSDIRVTYTTIVNDSLSLDIFLQERPRLSSLKIEGIRTSEIQDLNEKIALPNGSQITAFALNNTERIIKTHYIEKGYLNTEVTFIQKQDPNRPNNVILTVNVDKKDKVKISEIRFIGLNSFDAAKLIHKMKSTKPKNWNFFRSSKFIQAKYEEDKTKLYKFYNDNGYKDFAIITDSIYRVSEDRVGIQIRIFEGKQYYLRKISWVGNSIYTKEMLSRKLNIIRGSVYNQSMLEKRLSIDEDAVSSLYLDHGYLFSKLIPIEAKVEGDSIDMEIRIFEGDQAYLNNIIISGNTRTNEHVPRRELYTLPGDLFSKENIIRSVRQIGVLGHFDPEKINPQPIPDVTNGTVDLLYALEERANDQFEISGGWGAGMLVGTIGVRFNNFAMRNFFKLKEWKPYPSGDGQSVSIRAQTNGRIYQSYNLSFVEPWLGGTKPNTLNVSLYHSLMTNGQKKGEDGRQSMTIDGASAGIGKRLTWPDDYFSIYGEINYQKYNLHNYTVYSFLFSNGISNLLSFTARLTRFSTSPNLIYPRSGSSFSLSLQLTPPYSLISGKDLSNATDAEKYKWIEFHKWVFKADYYIPLSSNTKLVLDTRFAFGYIGYYNPDIGPSPFENFYVGGDGMTGYSLYGRDIVGVRGYTNGSLTPPDPYKPGVLSGNVYSKLTFEIRYPVTLNPQATIFVLTFLEAGKGWYELKDYNPFAMNRSAGFGVRANLPMFGLLGVDWGYGFDKIPGNPNASGSQFHFVIGQQF